MSEGKRQQKQKQKRRQQLQHHDATISFRSCRIEFNAFSVRHLEVFIFMPEENALNYAPCAKRFFYAHFLEAITCNWSALQG